MIFAISVLSAMGFCIFHLNNSAIFAISAVSAKGDLYLTFA